MQAKEEARAKAAHSGGPPFEQVTHRVGFLGLLGKRVPSRRFYQDQITESEWSIDREREAVFADGISRAYFVVFETQVRLPRGPSPVFGRVHPHVRSPMSLSVCVVWPVVAPAEACLCRDSGPSGGRPGVVATPARRRLNVCLRGKHLCLRGKYRHTMSNWCLGNHLSQPGSRPSVQNDHLQCTHTQIQALYRNLPNFLCQAWPDARGVSAICARSRPDVSLTLHAHAPRSRTAPRPSSPHELATPHSIRRRRVCMSPLVHTL